MNFQENKIIFQGQCGKRNNENFIPKKLTPYTHTIYPYIYPPAVPRKVKQKKQWKLKFSFLRSLHLRGFSFIKWYYFRLFWTPSPPSVTLRHNLAHHPDPPLVWREWICYFIKRIFFRHNCKQVELNNLEWWNLALYIQIHHKNFCISRLKPPPFYVFLA